MPTDPAQPALGTARDAVRDLAHGGAREAARAARERRPTTVPDRAEGERAEQEIPVAPGRTAPADPGIAARWHQTLPAPEDERLDRLRRLVRGRTGRGQEREILDLLADAEPAELRRLLTGIDADDLFDSVDNRLLGPDHRDELVELLTVTRRDDLGIEGRAAVIHALQDDRTGRTAELLVRDLLLDVHGDELTALKNTINRRTDIHDLEGLVFGDIDDEAIRAEILDHIATEAATVSTGEAKVLSDIDDTAFCALHDRRYPKGIIYPGILALWEALDRGAHAEPYSLGDLTFLTARPMDAFGLVETRTRRTLQAAGVAQSSVLLGSFGALRNHDAMAARKAANVEHYRLLYPEYDLVFVGDSGQGDVTVGELLYEQHPDAVRAVFIHDVKETPDAERAALAAHGIHVVDTYVRAAAIARDLGLITQGSAETVLAETREGFDGIAWDTPEQERAMRDHLERDAALV
jgi:hypothetical protein